MRPASQLGYWVWKKGLGIRISIFRIFYVRGPNKVFTGMLKHCPLPCVTIPGVCPTSTEGMRAVVPFLIKIIFKMLALRTLDQTV
jgi:hypothetical protein